MSGTRLSSITRIAVGADVVAATLNTLQKYGSRSLEGLVLWLGEVEGTVAVVTRALEPDQTPIASEDGVGYFVDSDTLFRLNRVLALSGLRLIAQVHSHPTIAYHSEADDRYAIVTAEGGLSLVVPNFGRAPANPAAWAVYRLRQGEWCAVETAQAEELIKVTPPR